MPQPYMAALLANRHVSYSLQRKDQAIAGYVARQSHAASTGINSSLT